MLNTKRFIFTTLGIISIYSLQLFGASSQEVQEVIRARAEYVQEFRDTYLQDETISGVVVLPIFYEKRDFMPAWTEREKIDHFLDLIESMILEGLNPNNKMSPFSRHIGTNSSMIWRARSIEGRAASTKYTTLIIAFFSI